MPSSFPYFEGNRQNVTSIILWHNSSTNETQFWYMDGNKVARRGTVLGEDGKPVYIGPPWNIVGMGNMDDGGQPDIVWYNSSTGEIQIWFMNGHRLVRRGTVLGEDGRPAYIGPPWSIAAIADRKIIWHNNSTNETQIWFMDGNRVTRRGTVLGEDGRPAYVGPPWSIVASDYSHIVWHNSSTNETQFWYMENNKVARRGTVLWEDGRRPAYVGPPWSIVGVIQEIGDTPNIIWYNSSTGETQFWLMDGNRINRRETVLGEDGRPAYVGPPFSIVGVGTPYIPVEPGTPK